MNNLTIGATIAQERFLTPFNLDMPEVETTLFKAYGNYGLPQYQILRNLGFTKAVSQNHGKYFYLDRPNQLLHTAGPLTQVTAPAPGVCAVYSFVLSTVPGTNDLILGAVAPQFPQYPSTPYYYQPVIEGYCLRMPAFDNGLTGTVIGISGVGTNTVTITFRLDVPNVGLTPASYVAGTPIIIQSNAHATGTDMPEGETVGVLEDFWFTQNIWNSMKIDGDMLTNKLWTTKTSDGKTISGYRAINQYQLDYKHARHIDEALWWGPGNNNPLYLDPNYNSLVYKTEGIIPYAQRTGSTVYYPIGGFNPLFFDQIDGILAQNYAGKYFMICCDNKFSNEFTNALVDYFKFTNIDYVTSQAERDLFNMGQTGKGVKVDFQYFEKNNRVYCKNEFFQFNDPTGMGAPGYEGNNFAFICPIGTKPDPKSPGNKIPYFGMYYKAMDGYSRLGEVVYIPGATNGQHYQSKDQNLLGYKSQIAAVHVGGNNMIIVRGV
jgi:hypothetical protein